MTEIESHPAADLFPLITGRELSELADNIRENGLLQTLLQPFRRYMVPV